MTKQIACILLIASASVAAESTDELRKEFDAYKARADARIEALELHQRTAANLSGHPVPDFEFHGYFRAGIGVNGDGDGMEAFQAPNANAKYRLGNETESYVEATFQQNFQTDELLQNHVDFHTVLTFAYATPTIDNNSFDTTTSLREAYAAARGVLREKEEALIWAGNRFYEHLDIHINDFFFRDMAGFGGGIEDLRIGNNAYVAVAWLGGSIDELSSNGTAYTNDYHFNKNTIDLRLYGLDTKLGSLALSFDIAHFGGDALQTATNTPLVVDDSLGWAAGAILTSLINDNIRQRFTVQYGTGAADNFKTVITAPQGADLTAANRIDTDSTRRLRLTDDVVVETGTPVSLQAVALYELYDNGTDVMNTIDWVSLGLRPVYHFNTYFSVAVEGGFDYTNQEDGTEGVLGKFTVAPQIQPAAGHFSRPCIRAFATVAAWSDGFEGLVSPVSYGSGTQGFSCGVQMEAWW